MPNRASVRPHTRIRKARIKAGFSQSQLAVVLNIHRSAVSQWETPNGSLPTLENLIRLADLTDVNLDWLGVGRGKMHFKVNPEDSHGVLVEHYAHDHDEVNLLANFRSMPITAKKALMSFFDAFGTNSSKLKSKMYS